VVPNVGGAHQRDACKIESGAYKNHGNVFFNCLLQNKKLSDVYNVIQQYI
jgi:hypothetical protein